MRAVRGTGKTKSVVRRPDHVRVLSELPDGRGVGAKCEGCAGTVAVGNLDRGSAERVLGEFFRYHRKCRAPATIPRAPSPPSPRFLDLDALRTRGQELLEQARQRAARR